MTAYLDRVQRITAGQPSLRVRPRSRFEPVPPEAEPPWERAAQAATAASPGTGPWPAGTGDAWLSQAASQFQGAEAPAAGQPADRPGHRTARPPGRSPDPPGRSDETGPGHDPAAAGRRLPGTGRVLPEPIDPVPGSAAAQARTGHIGQGPDPAGWTVTGDLTGRAGQHPQRGAPDAPPQAGGAGPGPAQAGTPGARRRPQAAPVPGLDSVPAEPFGPARPAAGPPAGADPAAVPWQPAQPRRTAVLANADAARRTAHSASRRPPGRSRDIPPPAHDGEPGRQQLPDYLAERAEAAGTAWPGHDDPDAVRPYRAHLPADVSEQRESPRPAGGPENLRPSSLGRNAGLEADAGARPDEVTVTIGRVEVRVGPPAPVAASQRPSHSRDIRRPSRLDDYLRARAAGRAG